MSFPLFPEHVSVRQMAALNADPDEPFADTRHCATHDFEDVVEVYRSVIFGQAVEEWRCPGIDGEDAHDVQEEFDLSDPDAGRDEIDA